MTILFIQPVNPAQAVARIKAWQPELVGTPLDAAGNPLPEQVLINTYTQNFYLHKGPKTYLRRRPDPPADPDAPAPPLPPGHLLEDVYTIQAITPAGDAILAPIVDDLHEQCLRNAAWRTVTIAPGLQALPVHTHAMRAEQRDARRAWQLVGETMDYPGAPTRAQLAGMSKERGGVRVDWVGTNRIRVRGKSDRDYDDPAGAAVNDLVR